MTTLIAAYNSRDVYGERDAKCYNADSPAYECNCRGANHGAGFAQAMDNTREMFESWLEDWEAQHPDTIRFEVPAIQPVQPSLF
jgi:hypothetical protein